MHTPKMTLAEHSLRWDLERCQEQRADLLKALETLVKCHKDGGFVQPDDDVIITARQAIAKAKGDK